MTVALALASGLALSRAGRHHWVVMFRGEPVSHATTPPEAVARLLAAALLVQLLSEESS